MTMFHIGGQPISPGERRNLYLSLGSRPDGSPVGIPVVVIRGVKPGPTLGVTAGIHGEEYEGPEGLRRFLAKLDPATLKGTVIATPQANPYAHEVFDRRGHVDYLDLNRSFPGTPDGFVTQRIANLLVTEVVARLDFLVDLHSAGLCYDLVPYAGFNSTPGALGEASFALAQAFGIPYLYGSTPFPNVMRLEAAKRNIPAVLVEVGGEGRLKPELIPLVENGLFNVARHIGLLEGAPVNLPAQYRIVRASHVGEFVHTPTGGFLVSAVKLGEEVEVGQVLGRLVDVFGGEIARLEAPVTGVNISYRTLPVTRTGDWGYAILPCVDEVAPGTKLAAVKGLN